MLCREGWIAVEEREGLQELLAMKHVNIARQPSSRQQSRNLKEKAIVEIKYSLGYMLESDNCHGKKLGIKDYEADSRKGTKEG